MYHKSFFYKIAVGGSSILDISSNNEGSYYSKEEILQNVVYDQAIENKETKPSDETKQKLLEKFTTSDFAKHMPTFWRLKRKLQKIEQVYPELYYRDQNIFELFCNADEMDAYMDSSVVHSEVENDEFIWI